MRLNGDLDALEVMGISPIRFVVAPALISLILTLPILVAVANVPAFWAASVYIKFLLGIACALGGSDGIENTLSETIIFMAATVIDPGAERQPHSAFRTRNRRKAN